VAVPSAGIATTPPAPRPWRDEDFVRTPRTPLRFVVPGSAERQQQEQLRQARILTRAPRGGRVIAVVSGKGGVGKTTTTLMLGDVLARERGDRIGAIDCNHDTGSLAMRLPRISTQHTVADLVRDALNLRRYADVQEYVTECPSRLSVLASSLDPDVSRSLGPEEYRTALAVLAYHWSVVICDLGTGLTDPPTAALLGHADQYVIVTGPQLDEGKVATHTLDWLARRFPERAARATVVINDRVGRGRTDVDPERVSSYFRGRARAVVHIPWDRELASGGAPRWERLARDTRTACMDLAATVAEDFVIETTGQEVEGN
jgi:putative peptide zinc metalloprotease protein